MERIALFLRSKFRVGKESRRHLTAALSEICGIDAVSVSSLEASPADSGSEQICYEIMEPCGPDAEAPREKEWVAVDCLVESGFRDPGDFQAVRRPSRNPWPTRKTQRADRSEGLDGSPIFSSGCKSKSEHERASSQWQVPPAQCVPHVQLDSL